MPSLEGKRVMMYLLVFENGDSEIVEQLSSGDIKAAKGGEVHLFELGRSLREMDRNGRWDRVKMEKMRKRS